MNYRIAKLGICTILALAISAAAAAEAAAQIHACYVQNTGVIYRIDPEGTLEGGLPTACRTPDRHIQFSWVDAAGADHGSLTGLDGDDHPQYLLADGIRALSGDLSAGGNKLTGLAAATAAGDAVPYEQAVKVGDAAGGDLGGTFPNPTVSSLHGNIVSATPPADGQMLSWDGTASEWTPTSLNGAASPWGGLVEAVGASPDVWLDPGKSHQLYAQAQCPEGYVVVNGGYYLDGFVSTNIHRIEEVGSYPRMDYISSDWSWGVYVAIQNGAAQEERFRVTVHALCAPTGSS